MSDPYYRYDASADRGSVARSSFPGYLTPKAPSFVSHQPLGSSDLRVASDFPQREISAVRPSPYGLDETAGIGVHPEPVMGAITAGASVKGYSSPPQDPSLIVQRRDVALGIGPPIPGRIEMPNSLRNVNGSLLIKGESNILFVDGLPTDCTRREVAHLFRPFIGYREIKVVHKEPRRSGDKAMVLCFVEFMDSKCAVTAMEALNGYKFDDKKPESPTLRIQFAQFPFRPSDGDEQRIGIPR
ncbi:RNA-binding protein 1-like [Pistacia vera]|uniref:RNA-binding protein 1-like n=1 Tax=Pistacia vera TaxID=55513 RepID=UPI001262CD5D|nr:RNA-binding protein 1-like [Pistacia vera]